MVVVSYPNAKPSVQESETKMARIQELGMGAAVLLFAGTHTSDRKIYLNSLSINYYF